MFIKYQHLEKLNTAATAGITTGACYLSAKLDGANACIWAENGVIKCGSRNNELHLGGNTLSGFFDYVQNLPQEIKQFIVDNNIRLYGEWLTRHSIKTYKSDAWNKFYLFDVVKNDDTEQLNYYLPEFFAKIPQIEYIPFKLFNNPTDADIKSYHEENNWLLDLEKYPDARHEGVVIKNYDWFNRFGRQEWAKCIDASFKHSMSKKNPLINQEFIDYNKIFVGDCLDLHLLVKSFNKVIDNEHIDANIDLNAIDKTKLGQFIQLVQYDLIKEELPEFLLKNKYKVNLNFQVIKKLVAQECVAFFDNQIFKFNKNNHEYM